MNSLKCIATIDIKSDEAGLLKVAKSLRIPIRFFTKEELSGIDSPNPSDIVNKHIGVPSVCEASAILASEKGKLIVLKQISPNGLDRASQVMPSALRTTGFRRSLWAVCQDGRG